MVEDEYGRMVPQFTQAPEPDWFTYPPDLLAKAVEIWQLTGSDNPPTIKETLYFDVSWYSQVSLYKEGLEWAKTALDNE